MATHFPRPALFHEKCEVVGVPFISPHAHTLYLLIFYRAPHEIDAAKAKIEEEHKAAQLAAAAAAAASAEGIKKQEAVPHEQDAPADSNSLVSHDLSSTIESTSVQTGSLTTAEQRSEPQGVASG